MTELVEKLKKKLAEEYGIENAEQLILAAAEPGPDIGIFLVPAEKRGKT